MALTCPDCHAAALEIRQRIELPPDARSDEVAVQVLRCGRCGLEAIGVYEESRRGALDSEHWSHRGYRAGTDALRELKQLIRDCPKPKDPRCECASHERLSGPDGWSAMLAVVDWRDTFAIER